MRTGRRGEELSVCTWPISFSLRIFWFEKNLTPYSSTETAGHQARPSRSPHPSPKRGLQEMGCTFDSCIPSFSFLTSTQPPIPFESSTPSPLPANFLLITASFGRILTPSMLGLFQRGRKLNVHPSLLPKYRGPAPIQWSILGEEKETGVCITEMLRKNEGEGIDGGDLWGIEKVVCLVLNQRIG